MNKILLTYSLFSTLLIAGLVSGYVRIGNPETMQEMAYSDSQRAMMNALVEGAQ